MTKNDVLTVMIDQIQRVVDAITEQHRVSPEVAVYSGYCTTVSVNEEKLREVLQSLANVAHNHGIA